MVTNRWMGGNFRMKESGFVEWVKVNYLEHMADLIHGRMKKMSEF